jgi:hypothetical protein
VAFFAFFFACFLACFLACFFLGWAAVCAAGAVLVTHETSACALPPAPVTVTSKVWWPGESFESFAEEVLQDVPFPSIVHSVVLTAPASAKAIVGLRLVGAGLPSMTTPTGVASGVVIDGATAGGGLVVAGGVVGAGVLAAGGLSITCVSEAVEAPKSASPE